MTKVANFLPGGHAEPFDKLRINSAKHLYDPLGDPSVATNAPSG
jgi:hypothetical protein